MCKKIHIDASVFLLIIKVGYPAKVGDKEEPDHVFYDLSKANQAHTRIVPYIGALTRDAF